MLWKTSPKSVEIISKKIKFYKKNDAQRFLKKKPDFTIPTYAFRWKKGAQPKPICPSKVSNNDKAIITQKLKETSIQCYKSIKECERYNNTSNPYLEYKSFDASGHKTCKYTFSELDTENYGVLPLPDLLKDFYSPYNLNPVSVSVSSEDLRQLYFMYVQKYLTSETLKNIQCLLEEVGVFDPSYYKTLIKNTFDGWYVSLFPPARVFSGKEEENAHDPARNPLWYILSYLYDFGEIFCLKERFYELIKRPEEFFANLKRMDPDKNWFSYLVEKFPQEYQSINCIYKKLNELLRQRIKNLLPDISIDDQKTQTTNNNESLISTFHLISESDRFFHSALNYEIPVDAIDILWIWTIQHFASSEKFRQCKGCEQFFAQTLKSKPKKYCSSACKDRTGSKRSYNRKKHKKV